MKQTAIQQAIEMVRIRIEALSLYDNIITKHKIHQLQQVERELYELLDAEKEQIQEAYWLGTINWESQKNAEEYYKENYEKK